MSARPQVGVLSVTDATSSRAGELPLPAVFSAPLRHDVVKFVHAQISKNRRQPYAVARRAGHQHSAESWGTGRAVARIPRVAGGGTHAIGQGAFGNMCRGGHMFAPTKTYRKWHVAVPRAMRRVAVAAAIAASGVAPLVEARGHRIGAIREIPLVVTDAAQKLKHTKDVLKLLKAVGCGDDVVKVRDSRHQRAGKGKMRDRRTVSRKGPLIVFKGAKDELGRAARNIPGVDTCDVSRLSLLKLAPGGHMGRLVVWTESALKELDAIYGDASKMAPKKHGWRLPALQVTQPDITRVLNSAEVQSALRGKRSCGTRRIRIVNPLRNARAMARMNPFAKSLAAMRCRKVAVARDHSRKVEKARAAAVAKAKLPKHEAKAKAPAAKAAAAKPKGK